MILALSTMSAAWRAVFFILAIACFLGAVVHPNDSVRLRFLGAAGVFFVFVFAYDAVAAA